MDTSNLESLQAVACDAARAGAAVALEWFARIGPADARSKSRGVDWNPVSEADQATERAVADRILRSFPESTFLTEENTQAADPRTDTGDPLRDPPADGAAARAPRWIVDPIDGTVNFLHGMPHFAVSVGCATGGVMLAAACYDPIRDEMYSAARGLGATCNGRPVATRGVSHLADALVCTGFYYDRGPIMRRTLATIEALFAAGVHGIRRSGSAVLDLCWVASGRPDAFFEYTLAAWDFAAAWLVLEEAGGSVSGADGEVLTLQSTDIAGCASPELRAELLACIGSVPIAEK